MKTYSVLCNYDSDYKHIFEFRNVVVSARNEDEAVKKAVQYMKSIGYPDARLLPQFKDAPPVVMETNDTTIINFTNDPAKSLNNQSPKTSSNSGGCYVATCVYGSYDCPQVWTLRRYRDDTLSSTWYGRLFVRFYYAISPTLVKWFGETKWFKKLWKGKLDRMVAKLRANGVDDTPYQDKKW